MTLPKSRIRTDVLTSVLRSGRLFGGLPRADVERVASLATTVSLRRGEYLFREGAASRGFYVVQRGAINVHRLNASGREQVIHVFRDGESFAEATLATETGYPADARAVEASQVLLIEKAGFLALLRRRPELAIRMLGSMSVHLRVLVTLVEDLTLKDVETRLANWLLKRCPDPGSRTPVTIPLNMTKRLLAAELGTVSETLSRTLARLREQGIVSVKGRILQVLSPALLQVQLRRNLGESADSSKIP